ncbi:MAG: glycine cleavage system protein GcvH [Betaproteobacteria bacterium]|nr:glycine cleavage system protein GcvH [Betaproteobacteria bacterium]
MASVKNCNLPDDLYYNVENNVWARKEPDGTVTIGMTAYACALAGEVVAYTPKKVGRGVELNKSAATVESGKWVGPVKAPVGGEVIAVNEAVSASPKTINADPYGTGWLVRIKPANWDADSAALVTGPAVAPAFEQKMAADGFAGCP